MIEQSQIVVLITEILRGSWFKGFHGGYWILGYVRDAREISYFSNTGVVRLKYSTLCEIGWPTVD